MIESEDSVLVQETGVGRFQVRADTGEHQLYVDEPAAFGGGSSGPNPFDLIEAALGACTLMTMRLYAERKGWSPDSMSVRVTHHKGSPAGRDRFERVLDLGEMPDEQRARLVQIAQRCPVHLLLERGADVSTTLADAALEGGVAEGLHAQLIDELCNQAN